MDALVSEGGANSIVWYSNDDGAGGSFTKYSINTDAEAARCVKAADIDGGAQPHRGPVVGR